MRPPPRSALLLALLGSALWLSCAAPVAATPIPATVEEARAALPAALERLEASYYAANTESSADPASPASLQIIDLRGRPIEGALVRLLGPREAPQIPVALTDAQGRVPLPAGGPWSAEVLAGGYQRASVGGTAGRLVVRRDHATVLAELPAVTDPTERAWRLLELLSPPPMAWDPDMAFLSAPTILPDLRLLVDSGRFTAADDRDISPRARARGLLARWDAPEDHGRIDPPDEARRRTPALTAPDPWSLCARFTDHHFTEEGAPDPAARTWNLCGDPALSLDGSRALMKLYVRYAHWGYEIGLTMRREGEGWRLYDARTGQIDHMEAE